MIKMRINKMIAVLMTVVMLFCSMNLGSSADTYSVNTLKGYNVYDANTRELVDGYILEANPYPTSNSTREVIDGVDERENSTYVKGVVEVVNNWFTGTGFVVDDHVIATAAHCVWDGTADASSTSKNVLYVECVNIRDQDGVILKGNIDVIDVHVPRKYINTSDEYVDDANPYDYALLTVAEDLSAYVNLDLGVMREEIKESNVPITITGFPYEVNDVRTNKEMYTASGTIESYQYGLDSMRLFCHNVDTSDGNSGGPVYTVTEYKGKKYYTVIGIHVFGKVDKETEEPIYNAAIRITTDLLHFYKNNPYAEYEGDEVI